MPLVATNCPHVDSQGNLSIVENVIAQKETYEKCCDCENEGPNLWLCLHPECRYVGCAEQYQDHNTLHNKQFLSHTAHLNLSSYRIWCYSCQTEVHTEVHTSVPLSPNMLEPKIFGNTFSGDASISIDPKLESDTIIQRYLNAKNRNLHEGNLIMNSAERGDTYFDKSEDSQDSSESDEDFSMKSKGLVGLQNIGNTCYMNSALQALSNVPPLTQFFINCGAIVTYISRDRKPGLSLSYLNLMKEMWSKRTRGFVVPHGVLAGIRAVHPMFRGYHQHDTQEFLRCFMDQLHEELKEIVEDDRDILLGLKKGEQSSDEEETEGDGNASSQSDGEYETCDSGVSEQSSLSDEGERGMKRRYSRVGQAEKLRNKFTNRTKKGAGDGSYSQQQKSQGSPSKHRQKKQMKTRSIISEIFDGKLLSSVQCLTCDRISTRVETFQDLSLPIPSRDHIDMLHHGSLTPQKVGPCSDVVYVSNQSGWPISWLLHAYSWLSSLIWGPAITLHHCLSAFFSADELKGDNMYSCEKCNKLRNGIKYSKVLELPEVLCIHLKRFRHELMFSSKIASYVSFPLEGLDMQPYLHKDCISKVTTYDLISVICHHGTAGGGHYVCYALNSLNNQWFEFDDQCVTPVSPETVKNCGAYVLFYRKSSSEMQQLREKTYELTETTTDTSDLNFFVSKQWINRFNSFSEPGPIDNTDFLCPHGGVNPVRSEFVDKLCMPIRQTIWEHLFKTFGGGPICTHLYECAICEEKHETLEKHRHYESNVFNQLSRPDNPTALYALAMSWFRQWQSFIKCKETEPPGPIDNSSIVVNKGGQISLKVGSDYGPIPEELWKFFVNIYGGGPEVMLHSIQRPVPAHSSIPTHSAINPNLADQNSKVNRVDAKPKQVSIAENSDSTSIMDDTLVADNQSTVKIDTHVDLEISKWIENTFS